MIQIAKKITGYSIVEKTAEKTASPSAVSAPPELVVMNETVQRPETLVGVTYKIKSPMVEHALYVTINDIILNPGASDARRPFEIFVNSKNMEHFQWVVALTRIISAVFRKGGDITFLAEELRAVFDPRGGYFRPGGLYMPSIVAELGLVIEQHLKSIGMLPEDELSDGQKSLIEAKKSASRDASEPASEPGTYPANAGVCQKCHVKAVVESEGCKVCLACAWSKCG